MAHSSNRNPIRKDTLMDLTTLSDEDLATHKREVLIEEERRQNREAIPATIADLAHKFVEAGGDPADLQHAITG